MTELKMTRIRRRLLELLVICIIATVPAMVFASTEGELESGYGSVEAEAVLAKEEYAYTGKLIKPEVRVTVSGLETPLTEGTDYTVAYENNRYPGKGHAVVKGAGSYEGQFEIEKNFTIKMNAVTGLKVKKRYAKSLKLEWNKSEGVTGYKIYRIESGQWKLEDEVQGASHNQYTSSNLESATPYTYAVKAYVDTEEGEKLSPMSDRLSAATKPEPTKITDKKGLVCAVKIQWEKKKCTGYEVQVSRDSSFKKIAARKTVSSKHSQAYIYDLAKEQKYYVRVRPYLTRNGNKIYGNWSYYKTVTTKPISAGWNTIKGYKYYYSMGYALTGSQEINGNPYYFDGRGRLMGSSYSMWKKAQNASSSTSWLLVTDTHTNATGVYYRSGSSWILKKYIRCSTGAYDTPTIKGNYYVCSKGYSFSDEDYTCWYWTGFYGSEYLYHSVPYVTDSKVYFRDSRIGMNISHGCVRMTMSNAKWIYNNIPYYTKVITF